MIWVRGRDTHFCESKIKFSTHLFLKCPPPLKILKTPLVDEVCTGEIFARYGVNVDDVRRKHWRGLRKTQ